MARYCNIEGAVDESASYTLWASKWFPVQCPIKPRPKPLPRSLRRLPHNAESLAKSAFAGRGDDDRARLRVAADSVQRKTARRQRRTEGAADMQAPLAPVETGPAIDMPACGPAEIHPELAAKAEAGLGHRAALARQLDIAVLGQCIGQPDAELAGEMVVAGAGRPHRLVARAGDDRFRPSFRLVRGRNLDDAFEHAGDRR